MSRQDIREILDDFEADKFTDAKEKLQDEIRGKVQDYLNRELDLKDKEE